MSASGCELQHVLQDLEGDGAENPVVAKLASFVECLHQQPTRDQLLPCVKQRADWVLALLRTERSLRQYGAEIMTDALDLPAEDAKIVQVQFS